MPVTAITSDYQGEKRDRLENFHGNQVVYVGWDHHMMFCAPFAYLVQPDAQFESLLTEVMPASFGLHPEFRDIDWNLVLWKLDGEDFIPRPHLSLVSQGIGHKSVLRFHTPELKGYQGAGV